MPHDDTSTLTFDAGDIATPTLATLVAACAEGAEPRLVLPPIQRGSVWSPKKIVTLWDSVLRGLPIGSLLVYKMEDDARAASANVPAAGAGLEEGRKQQTRYALFDGQQRIKALQSAWPSSTFEDGLCLWIDLGVTGTTDGAFAFRVTTVGRPFGYSRGFETPFKGWELTAAREAYEGWLEADGAFEEATSDLRLFGRGADRRPTPWKTSAWTAPLRDVLTKIDAGAPFEKVPFSRRYEPDEDAVASDTQARDHAVHAFADLSTAWARAKGSRIAIQRIADDLLKEHAGETGQADQAGVLVDLFERIGRGGVQLSPADLTFSKIKQVYPPAYEAVRELYHAEVPVADRSVAVGALLGQTNIILLALRIARAVGSVSEGRLVLGIPGPNDVHSVLADDTLTACAFKKLVPKSKGETEEAAISHVLQELIRVLSYSAKPDMGLPRPCLAYLDFELISVLALWLAYGEQDAARLRPRSALRGAADASREELIRFVLWWRLCVNDQRKSAATALRHLLAREYETFPGEALYDAIGEEGFAKEYAWPLIHPERLPFTKDGFKRRRQLDYWQGERAKLLDDATSYLRADHETFGVADEYAPEPGKSEVERRKRELDALRVNTARQFWHAKPRGRIDILIWLQRDYVHDTFRDYDPLALRENDLPYDLDHISPHSHSKLSYARKTDLEAIFGVDADDPRCRCFRAYWWHHTNAIGNYRVLPLGQNRSDGNTSIADKIEGRDGRTPSLPSATAESSFRMQPRWEEEWKEASGQWGDGEAGGMTKWPPKRIDAFQRAIEGRTEHLYRAFYEEAGFEAWLERDGVAASS